MSQIPPDIVGEPYKQYVKDQIKIRQRVSAAGFSDKEKTPQEVAYLTSKNAWVKCASSVYIEEGSDRFKRIGIDSKGLLGSNLAKKYILFNGISDYNDITERRGGISQNTDPLSEALYGFGGQDFGQRPMPGITSFNIGHNNIGTLRTAQLKIVANNRTQFDIIETLYVRLGFTIFVEWGNNMYFTEDIDEDGKKSQKLKYTGTDTVTLIDDGTWFKEQKENPTTDIEFFNKIESRRKDFAGNYDAFFGKVVNFDWSFTSEGTYEIILHLRSLGDVVESFKVNALDPSGIIQETAPEDAQTRVQKEANKGSLLNELYCLRKDEDNDLFNVLKDGSIPYVKTTALEDGFIQDSSVESYYIKISELLERIEKLSPHKKQEGSDVSEPMVKISTDLNNYMRLFPGLNSTNPGICVIRNTEFIKIDEGLIGDIESNLKSFENFDICDLKIENKIRGRVMNIYLNLNFVESSLEKLAEMSSDGDVTIFEYIKNITVAINKCFGGYINLEPSLQSDTTIVIKDLNLETRVKEDGSKAKVEQEDKDGIIKVFGYNPSELESNFVRSFSFNTSISNKLSAQLSIGAARGNQTTKNISNFFKNLNRGIYDRYQKEVFDTKDPKDSDYEESKLLLGCKADKDNKKSKNPGLNVSGTRLLGTRNTSDVNFLTEEPTEPEKKEEQSDIQKAEDTFNKAKDAYYDYLKDCFGVGLQPEFKYPRYFIIKEKDTKRGASTLKAYIGSRANLQDQKAKQKGETYSGDILGFIPIVVTLDIEGMSGIKIYNALSIESEFLPVDYPDVVELIIVGINHVLQDNEWITQISAITKPNSGDKTEDGLDSVEDSSQVTNDTTAAEELGADDIEDGIVLFPPTGDFPFQIRSDGGGSGIFGAPRAGETHGGIDIVTQVPRSGENIVTQVPNNGDINIFKEYWYLAGRKRAAYLPYLTSKDPQTRSLAKAVLDGFDPVSGRGTTIFSPIDGKLLPSSANSLTAVLPGVKISGIGKYTGYIVLIFYMAYDKALNGRTVKKGQPIGNAVNMSIQPNYLEAGVTNHIHFEIRKLRTPSYVKIDPNNFKYSTDL